MMRAAIGLLALAAATSAQTPPAAPGPREAGLYATINTTQGAITVRLFEKEAPLTVKNFVGLAHGTKAWKDPKTGKMIKRPLYNGAIFHRVVPNFMIQGGDPTGTGEGDPGFTIPDELPPGLKFDLAGRVAMANVGPHTGNCQFFITETPTPHLNGLYTIFGQVVEGQDLVTKIAHAPAVKERPITPVRITSVVIKKEGPPAPGAAKKP